MGLDITFNKKSKEEYEEIGYFRKVNFLVQFFEDAGHEIENCVPIIVSKEDAYSLKECCEQVLEDHNLASTHLPTCSGFFFGSTDYDKHYFEDVERVLDFCNEILIPEIKSLEKDEQIEFEIWY